MNDGLLFLIGFYAGIGSVLLVFGVDRWARRSAERQTRRRHAAIRRNADE